MRYAPSASNSRGWKINIVSDEEKIKAISDASIKGAFQYMGFPSEESARNYFKSIDRDPILLKAPAVIFVSCNVGMPATDAAIIITHGRFAAHSLNLGTCWIGMMNLAIPLNKEILKIAGISEKDRVQGVFTIGYPSVRYHRTAPRLPLDVDGL
jgi:nitroreductase